MNDIFILKSAVDYSALAGVWLSTTLAEGELMVVDGDGALVDGGTLQVETATTVGTITTAGNATLTVTSALVTGSPLAITVPVALNDTATLMGAKFRAALNATAAITDHYLVSGAAGELILTARVKAANDSTLNIAIADDTSVGITEAATSANTTAGVALPLTATKLQLVLGTAEGTPKVSTMLHKAGFSFKKQVYVAPVAAIKHVGDQAAAAGGIGDLNLPSSLTVGDSCSIAIRDLSKPVEDTGSVRFYSVTAVSGNVLTGTTALNIVARLIAAINADANRVVNAVANEDGAGNIDGIKLTAITAGNDFAPFVLAGVLQNATVGTTTANVTGIGTAAQVLALEKDLSTRDGYTGRNAPSHMYSVASKVASGGTYSVYTLTSKYPLEGKLVQNSTYTNVCMVFVPSGETGAAENITALDSILASFVG